MELRRVITGLIGTSIEKDRRDDMPNTAHRKADQCISTIPIRGGACRRYSNTIDTSLISKHTGVVRDTHIGLRPISIGSPGHIRDGVSVGGYSPPCLVCAGKIIFDRVRGNRSPGMIKML